MNHKGALSSSHEADVLDSPRFRWRMGKELTEQELQECAELFSQHYGIWSSEDKRAGQPIKLSAKRIHNLVHRPTSWAALAYIGQRIIGYAFADRLHIPNYGPVTWVTQLVVHNDYRDKRIATRLLSGIWSFSDHFAWGLVTANSYAVRALEKSTRRRCTPAVISSQANLVFSEGAKVIPYISQSVLDCVADRCQINTHFHVNHAEVPNMIEHASKTVPWIMGAIDEGFEWFAFTFQDQAPFPLEAEELNMILADADETAKRAYQGMTLSSTHKWLKHTVCEADYIVSQLHLAPGASILDFGCGAGRHSIELAKRGYQVLGIDFSPDLIKQAQLEAQAAGLNNVTFLVADCRNYQSEILFDGAVCLYDVIGTFPALADNQSIIKQLYRNLRSGAHCVSSVLNYSSTLEQAKNIVDDVNALPDALLRLSPSTIMQETGQIFDQDYYLVDTASQVVYRKEQFDLPGHHLPSEIIVRDMRFTKEQLSQYFSDVGFELVRCQAVRTGRWDKAIEETSQKAREILYVGRKR